MAHFPSLDKGARIKIQILHQLVDEERAIVRDQEIVIPHAVAAGLPAEERAGLELPEVYLFFIEIRAAGNSRSLRKVIATNASSFTVAAREMAAARGVKLLAQEELPPLWINTTYPGGK